mmetsp:Transcript_77417/g.194677  ORF Transcript_77417/g.194677 Transcript_77417/m.194677 type:complete len:153 (+) Transcript_77417:276-734(+)
MKPAWDKLMAAFAGSPTVVVADVDCTADAAKSMCEAQGITGYPTIKFWNSTSESKGEAYSGGRDFKALKKFVKKTLGGVERKCDVTTKHGCLPEEEKALQKFEGLSAEVREKEATRLEVKLGDVLKAAARAEAELDLRMLRLMGKSAVKQEL